MSGRRAWALAAALTAVLTAALAAPVLRHPGSRVFGQELVGRHHDPFTVMRQYQDGHVPSPFLQPATDWAGIALARLAGGVSAYNLVVLLTFPLAALIACAHARYLIGSTTGALVAALLFAFSPFHLSQAAYHIHIAQIQWIPLFFLTLWRLLDRPGPGRAVAVAGALLLVGAASFYLGFITASVAPFGALAYWWRQRPRTARPLRSAAAALLAAALVLTVAVWLTAPRVLVDRGAFALPQDALGPHSARWWSYVAPPLGHPWLHRVAVDIWKSSDFAQGFLEQQVSLGWSVMALALVPVVYGLAGGSGRIAAVAPALGLIAAVAFFCSLPPALTIGQITIPTPSQFLHPIAPMFRSYARFGVIVALMTTTLAGGGVALLLEKRRTAGIALVIVLLAAAAFEYAPPRPAWRDVLPTSGHRWLAESAQPGARLLDCLEPAPGAGDGVAWLMGHEVVFLAGPFVDCGESDLGAKLSAFGLTHMLVRSRSPDAPWAAAGAVPDGMQAAARLHDAWLFEVVAPKPPLMVTGFAGFYPREYLGADSWRWMGANGTLRVANVTPALIAASIDLELQSFAVERRMTLAVDGVVRATILVTPARQWYRSPPLLLATGEHTLTCLPETPPLSPRTLTESRDPRPLSVSLRRWRWHISQSAGVS